MSRRIVNFPHDKAPTAMRVTRYLSVVAIVNRTQGWYDRGAPAA